MKYSYTLCNNATQGTSKTGKRAAAKIAAAILATSLMTMIPALGIPSGSATFGLQLDSTAFGTITAYAGPASDIVQANAQAGPSQSSPSTGTNASGPAGSGASQGGEFQDAGNNYYDAAYADSIVNPVDRYSYDQMSQDMVSLQNRYPNLMKIASIGTTPDGRPIYDAIIGNPGAKKKILFQGAMHAREYIVVPLLMRQMETLLQGAANGGTMNGQSVANILQNVCIHFVPMSNPDGVCLSQWGIGGIGSEEIRNNIQQMYANDVANGGTTASFEEYLRRWKSNARGVDLNHNFDAGWAAKQTAAYPKNIDYKGPSPLSEPETQALAGLIDREGFRTVINYHAMGDVIYWDTKGNREHAYSLELANLVHAANGYALQSCLGETGLKDWLQQRPNSVPGITIEVGRSAAPVNFGEFAEIWNQNKMIPGLIALNVMSQ